MSDDFDIDMEVVEEDELDDLGAGGASSMERPSRSETKGQDEESSVGADLEVVEANEADPTVSNKEVNEEKKTRSRLSDLPDSWSVNQIREIAEVVGGSTPSTKNEAYWGGDIPWATPTDVTGLRGTTITQTEDTITEEGLDSASTHVLPSYSVLMTSRATIGAYAVNTVPMATNQGFQSLVPGERLNTWYLFYPMLREAPYLESLDAGSTFSEVSKRVVEKVDIAVPLLPEQCKIASVLYAVDQVIQKTEAIIDRATQTQRGLLRELLTKGFDGRETMHAGALGEIPTDWRSAKLSQVADVQRGKFTHRPRNDPEFYDGAHPFIQTGEVVEARGKLTDYSQTLNEKGRGVSKRFDPGTIIITIAGNIGDTAIATFPVYFPDSLVGITPSDEVVPHYLEFFLRSRKKYLNRLATETTQKNLNLSLLRPIDVILPPLKEQRQIAGVLKDLDSKVRAERQYKHQLQRLKKGLMQDLLTGEVRTADKAIEVLDEVKAHG